MPPFYKKMIIHTVQSWINYLLFLSQEGTLKDCHDDVGGETFKLCGFLFGRMMHETVQMSSKTGKDCNVAAGLGGIKSHLEARPGLYHHVMMIV